MNRFGKKKFNGKDCTNKKFQGSGHGILRHRLVSITKLIAKTK